jgi:hypothetical protein
MAKKAAAAMLLATNRLGGGSVAASSAVLRRLDASAPPAAAPSIHRAEGALYDQPGSQFGGELRVPADTIAASHEDDEDVLRELPIDDLTKQAWSVTWSSNLGPFFWYNYGMVGVPWPNASREQKVDAIVMALKGARFRDVKVKYRGQGQNKGRWAFSTLQITGGDGVFSAAEQLLSAWELGGQTAKGADRSANVEDILRPTGVASFPVREAVVEQTKDRIREDLKKQSVPDRLAKGIKIHKSGKGYEARYNLPTSGASVMLSSNCETEEGALEIATQFLSRLYQDGFDISYIVGRGQQRYNGYQSDVQANLLTQRPSTSLQHAQRLTSRAVGIKPRLTCTNAPTTYVHGLSRFELADICVEGEKLFALAMTERHTCVGPPGSNVCPHAESHAQLNWFDEWCRIEYDHGPIAEIKDISTALASFVAVNGESASLAPLNKPLLRHIMYGMEWIGLPAEDGRIVQICPNLAPRCSRLLAKRYSAPGEEPLGEGCHKHTGHGWATDLVMKGALLREIGSLLPFTINVMLSSPGRPGILSEDAVAYIRQRSKIWTTLSLVPASPVMADASQDPSTSVAGSYGTADPLAKLACATLMLQLQQSAMLDLVHLVTLLCFIAIYSMTGSLLLHTPRRALLYLCFWASPFRPAIVSAILSAGMGGTTDGFAAVSYLFYATGRPKLAMLCCLTSSAGQLLRISEQSWDVLLTATLLRIGVKAATSRCLAWLARYCSTLPAPSDAVCSATLLLA